MTYDEFCQIFIIVTGNYGIMCENLLMHLGIKGMSS